MTLSYGSLATVADDILLLILFFFYRIQDIYLELYLGISLHGC